MKNILVTIDFEGQVELLIDKTFELATKFDSKVWLMHFASPDSDFVSYEVGPQSVRDSRAETFRNEHRLLQDLANNLKERGIDAEGRLIQGATVEMIVLESKKLNIDLIIAGHHEHGFIYNAIVGSVSAQLIRKSKIPILIIPFE